MLDWFVIIYSVTVVMKPGCQCWSSLKTRAVLFSALKAQVSVVQMAFLEEDGCNALKPLCACA